MEQQLLNLLAETQSASAASRTQAESRLKELYPNEALPLSLCSIASHRSVPTNLRQSALLFLRVYILEGWSPAIDEFKGAILPSESTKSQLREALLNIAIADEDDRKVKSAASYVVSKIASSDFPDQWPTLLPTLLHIIPSGSPSQIHGALKVLGDLVEDGLSDDQFFGVARDLVKVLYDTAVDESKKPTLRALAVSIFRACFDILEMVKESHRAAVKAFADEALNAWLPYFDNVMKQHLPEVPEEEEETTASTSAENWRGLVALKLQVVKTLMKIRAVFPALLSPQSPLFFSTTWQELSYLKGPYHKFYINDERQGRLEDADGLPYTLDFLVLEELDFMQSCLRAPPVRKQLEAELQSQNEGNARHATWLTEVMTLAVAYAQITTEEEGLWDIDVNVFLSEETSVTANYTPRTACGDLLIKLGEWLKDLAAEGLLVYAQTVFSSSHSTWKEKEATLYLLNQLLNDFHDVGRSISDELAKGFAEFIRFSIQQGDVFLRARGYLVAGAITNTSSEALSHMAISFMQQSLTAISNDSSEVVKVASIRVLQSYLQSLQQEMIQPFQNAIIAAISNFFSAQDPNELADSDELMVTIVETLRDAIALDTRICICPESGALSLLFTIASRAPNNFQLTMLVNETFEEIAKTISRLGNDAYARLCEIVLPSLTGAFDVSSMTGDTALTNLAADLLTDLAENGSEPLPPGFVRAVMPKLSRLLLSSTDGELLRPGTEAVKYMLVHDSVQMFEWHDDTGKSGLELCLVIIDRLLQQGIDDNAAAEVGGLAAELVEKAGSERLGPYLLQLLRAVAFRLASAEQAAFIQSLILVFARLCLVSAKDVVDFLAQVQMGDKSGLQVVMAKWLENSVTFAGYDEIRQNIIALSKLYRLEDQRLAETMVKGDLIIPTSDRIMTRSKTRQNPDQYTIIPVPLKIIKVLIEELSSASGASMLDSLSAAELAVAEAAAEGGGSDDANDDDDDWEDVPGSATLDLGQAMTKQQLMGFGNGTGSVMSNRQRDDETQAYLVDFFRDVSARNVGGFGELYQALTQDERERLGAVG